MKAEVQIFYNNKTYTCHHFLDAHSRIEHSKPYDKDIYEYKLDLTDHITHTLLDELFDKQCTFGVRVFYKPSAGEPFTIDYGRCRVFGCGRDHKNGLRSYELVYDFAVDVTCICQS